MESISEAFNKCFVADFICTISRTADDKVQGTGRMFVAKNRNGPDGLVFPMSIDTSRVRLRVHQQQTAEDINTIVTRTAQEQKKHLQEKYQKFKNRRKVTAVPKVDDTQPNNPLDNPLSKESLRKLAEETKAKRNAENRSAV